MSLKSRTGRERTMSAQNASTRPEITLVRVNSVIERRAPFRRSASFSVICVARRRYIPILHVVEQQENELDRTRIFSSHKIAVTTFYLCSSFFFTVFFFFFQRFPRAHRIFRCVFGIKFILLFSIDTLLRFNYAPLTRFSVFLKFLYSSFFFVSRT